MESIIDTMIVGAMVGGIASLAMSAIGWLGRSTSTKQKGVDKNPESFENENDK